LGFFSFLSAQNKNPYIRQVLKKSKALETKELIARLPSIANAIAQGADAIYHKLLYAQFQDYEQRYDCSIVTLIDEDKKAELIRLITGFMLYTFYNRENEQSRDAPSVPLTYALHFEIYKNEPKGESFLDYLTYQNPNFEDPKMAPAFKFGNEMAQRMRTMDTAFLFMASQQSVLIAEITQKILNGLLNEKFPLRKGGEGGCLGVS
jgi:hypothetical protein